MKVKDKELEIAEKDFKAESSKPQFLPYIHHLRGFAILLIVGIHCRTAFPWGANSVTERVLESILDNGTIIFVFISGFLFEHIFAHKFNFQTYLNKKLKYIIVPYLIVSVLPILDKLFLEEELVWLPAFLADGSTLSKVLYMLLTGKHFGPYWFIPMIVVFYLISPFLVWINKQNFYTYIFPMLFIAGLFTFKFGYYSNPLDSFIYFFPIYIFGMCTSFYKRYLFMEKFKNIVIPILAIYVIGTALEVIGVIPMLKLYYFELDEIAPAYLFNFPKLKVSLLCIALLLIFKSFKRKEIRILKELGDYSIGVFFVHLYFIVIIRKAVMGSFESYEMNLGLFLLFTLLITLLSIGTVMLTKRIFGTNNSRYILGS